jgi:hypothetical protein
VHSPLQLPLLTTLLGNVSFWVKNIQMINWIWHHNFFLFFWARNHEIIIMLQWMYCYAVCDLSNYIKVLAVNNLLFNTKSSFNYVPLVRVAFVQYPDSVSGLLSTDSSCDGLMAFNNILAPAFSVTAFSCQLVGRTYGRWCACACR